MPFLGTKGPAVSQPPRPEWCLAGHRCPRGTVPRRRQWQLAHAAPRHCCEGEPVPPLGAVGHVANINTVGIFRPGNSTFKNPSQGSNCTKA